LNEYLKLETWNLKLIDTRRKVNHAKGKRRTKNKREKEKGPKNGEGLSGRTKPALSNGG
jgi:hypothetical protein